MRPVRVGKFLALSAAGVFLLSSAIPGRSRQDDSPESWTAAKWIAWRDAQIKRILAPVMEKNGIQLLTRPAVITRCVDAYRFIGPFLARPGPVSQDAGLRRKLSHFVGFIRAQANLAHFDGQGTYDRSLGFDITDKDYWYRSAAELQFPSLLQRADFLMAVSSTATYKDAVELIAQQNRNLPVERKWIVLNYSSRFLKSADRTTYGRMLIVIPDSPTRSGTLLDRWIQFATCVPDGTVPQGNEIKSVSMVAVERGGAPGTAPRAYIADFVRQRAQTGGAMHIEPVMLAAQDFSKNCYECHKSAVLPIHPKTVYDFDSAGKLVDAGDAKSIIVQALNARVESYGHCDLADTDSAAYGPTIGPVGAGLTAAFVRAASPSFNLSDASVERVLSAVDCAKCHESTNRINFPQTVRGTVCWTSFADKKDLVQTYVEQGWMPPGAELAPDERSALWNCLRKEYLDLTGPSGVFVEWLKGK